MSYIYSDPKRADDKFSLPDIWITPVEAESFVNEDLCYQYEQEFPELSENELLAKIVEDEGLQGGWAWAYCLPGCLPDSDFNGPFESEEEAIKNAEKEQENYIY